jgi:hypothetical protein
MCAFIAFSIALTSSSDNIAKCFQRSPQDEPVVAAAEPSEEPTREE